MAGPRRNHWVSNCLTFAERKVLDKPRHALGNSSSRRRVMWAWRSTSCSSTDGSWRRSVRAGGQLIHQQTYVNVLCCESSVKGGVHEASPGIHDCRAVRSRNVDQPASADGGGAGSRVKQLGGDPLKVCQRTVSIVGPPLSYWEGQASQHRPFIDVMKGSPQAMHRFYLVCLLAVHIQSI